ncbi:MAG: IS4 family transposase [Desulfohalobium sp.]
MNIQGKYFTSFMLNWIQNTVATEPSISRLELSRRFCDQFSWYASDGRLKDMSCRKALSALQKRGLVDLPEIKSTYSFETRKPVSCELEPPELTCSLQELGSVEIYPVRSRYSQDSKAWRALLDRYHFLGSGQLCGAQIRYVIKSPVYGYLGALSFNSASWSLHDRDRFIGWSVAARNTNLPSLIANSRFLIAPTVQIKNLASHALSLALSRLPEDWEERYGVRPVLVETFVHPSRCGTCYKAANWTEVGKTAGRRDGIRKTIFAYPLCPDWRAVLCAEPPRRLGQAPLPEDPCDWAEQEFGAVQFFDSRLKRRLMDIARNFFSDPEATIPEACGSKAKTMGAYRFFHNEKTTMDVILNAHTEASVERIKQHKIVLAPQDTTTLNYSSHPMTADLGPINTKDDDLIGLLLHDTLAFTEDGTPLGVLDAQCWARDPDDRGKRSRRKQTPIEQKESAKWLRSYRKVAEVQRLCPETTLVSIGDRESDIFELFQEAQSTPDGPQLLVRAEKSRNRKVEQENLWEAVSNQNVAGSLKLHIPRRGSRKARETLMDIRFRPVDLSPPNRQSQAEPIRVWAVSVKEQEAEDGGKALEWLLLSTLEVASFEQARQKVEWYSARWGIEVYHRTLKSGCRLKDRQLGTADRLEACLGVDMIVAWRIYHLTMLGREVPDVACTVFFKDVEWKALCCLVSKTPNPPEKPPTLKEAVYMVAGIGGHLGRKNDGFPGTQTMWRGLQKLDTATEMYAIFTHESYIHPLKAGP